MLKSRREWFRHVTALAVALCRPGAPAEASRTPVAGTTGRGVADADPLLTRSMFAGLLGDGFRVQNRPLALELTSVGDLPNAAGTASEGADLSFTATFRAPAPRRLAQGTYTLSHAAVGSFPIFLVPVGAPGRDVRYEAVFNRLEE
jgi:hypothetical protein